ncbi:hypothetical protein DEA06_03450 [Microbacterium sp. Gd 4-13]|nr:hypothetical protein DEA06_03450 [Microbacterium sp. Gd 4-13]
MWEEVFQPACDTFGFEAIRADKISAPGEITDQVFVLLRDADLVIADLSGANPNVMYELGLRHSRAMMTIQVGEHGRLPFDVNTVRTIQFRRTESGLFDLRESLISSIRSALSGGGTATSATRVWSDAPPVESEALLLAARTSAAPEDPGEPDEPAMLEILADGETGIKDVAEHLGNAQVSILEINEFVVEGTAAIKASDEAGRGFAGRILVSRNLAANLAEPTADLDNQIEAFYEATILTDAMVRFIIRRMVDDPSEVDHDEAIRYLNTIEGLVEAAKSSETGVVAMGRAAESWAKVSRDLRAPGKLISRASHRYIEATSMMAAWDGPIAEAREALDGNAIPTPAVR